MGEGEDPSQRARDSSATVSIGDIDCVDERAEEDSDDFSFSLIFFGISAIDVESVVVVETDEETVEISGPDCCEELVDTSADGRASSIDETIAVVGTEDIADVSMSSVVLESEDIVDWTFSECDNSDCLDSDTESEWENIAESRYSLTDGSDFSFFSGTFSSTKTTNNKTRFVVIRVDRC